MRNYRRYPPGWKRIARQCKEAAGWRCSRCGVQHGERRISLWSGNFYPVYLQAAHKHHDAGNPEPDLVCVCPTCHWAFYRKPGERAAWVQLERTKHQRLIALAWVL